MEWDPPPVGVKIGGILGALSLCLLAVARIHSHATQGRGCYPGTLSDRAIQINWGVFKTWLAKWARFKVCTNNKAVVTVRKISINLRTETWDWARLVWAILAGYEMEFTSMMGCGHVRRRSFQFHLTPRTNSNLVPIMENTGFRPRSVGRISDFAKGHMMWCHQIILFAGEFS